MSGHSPHTYTPSYGERLPFVAESFQYADVAYIVRECTDIEQMRDALLERGNLENAREAFVARYQERFVELPMSTDDMDLLTILWLYDEDTLEHSIRTYEQARMLLATPMELPHGPEFMFGDILLEREGVDADTFLRSCLFHDIGKTSIPYNVLTDRHTDAELAMVGEDVRGEVLKRLGVDASDTRPLQELCAQHGVRPVAVVPMYAYMDAVQCSSLTEHGFATTDTLTDVLRHHAAASASIMSAHGYPVEAHIVARHHENRASHAYQASIATEHAFVLREAVTAAVEDVRGIANPTLSAYVLKCLDIWDAMQHTRAYKPEHAHTVVLAALVDAAERGELDRGVVYALLSHELAAIRDALHSHPSDDPAGAVLERIIQFAERVRRSGVETDTVLYATQ